MAVVWTSAYGAAVVETGTKMIVVSDIHVMAPSLLPDAAKTQSAWLTYYAGQRKMLEQSAEYFASFTESVVPTDAKLLLITGDLTKDGEQASHDFVKDKLAALKSRVSGIKIFVIPGNHDFGDEGNCTQFNADGTTSAAVKMTTGSFATFYADYGYGTENTQDPNGSLSYVAEPIDGLVILAIDSHTGSVPAATLTWICSQAKAAKNAGKQVIAMMHHPLFPHITGAQMYIGTYTVGSSETVRDALIDAGVKVILTGHFHTSDIAQDWKGTTKSGESIYDINTGSLISYPCDYRVMTLSEDKKTLEVTTSSMDTSCKDWLQSRVVNIIKAQMTPASARKKAAIPTFTPEQQVAFVNDFSSFGAKLFIAHAEGNEQASASRADLVTEWEAIKTNHATILSTLALMGADFINDNAIYSILDDKSNNGTDKADQTNDRTLSITLPEVTATVGNYEGTVTVGTATIAAVPLITNEKYSITQQLYTKEQLGSKGKGQLTSIGFNTKNGDVTRNLAIYVTHTTETSISSLEAVTAGDLVFSGDFTFTANQWNTIDFNNSLFAYDGTSNILVTIVDNTGKETEWGALTNYTYNISSQRVYADGDTPFDATNPPAGEGTTYYKAQMQFTFSDSPTPCGLALVYVSDKTAQVKWSPRGGATAVNLQYRKVGETDWTAVNGITTRSKELTGLTPATQYEVQVQDVFDGDKKSEWTSSLTFVTACCPTENMQPIQYVVNVGNASKAAFQIVDVEANVEVAYVRMDTKGETSGYLSLCCGRKYKVNWIVNDAAQYQVITESFKLLFTPGDVFYTMSSGPSEDTELTTFTMDCGKYCTVRPVELAVGETKPTSVSITYNSTTKTDQFVYSEDPDADPDALRTFDYNKSAVEAGSTFTLEELTPDNTYYVWVRSVCEGEGHSRWAGPLEVSTESEDAAPSVVTATPVSSTKEQVTWTGYGKEKKWNVSYRLFSSSAADPNDDDIELISDDGSLYKDGKKNYFSEPSGSSVDNVLVVANIPAGKGASIRVKQGNSAKKTLKVKYGVVKQDGKWAKTDLKAKAKAKMQDLKTLDKTIKKLKQQRRAETDEAKKAELSEQINELREQRKTITRNEKEVWFSAWTKAKAAQSRPNQVASSEAEDYYFFYIEHDDASDILWMNDLKILANENGWTVISNVSPSDYTIEELTPATTYETLVEPVYDDGEIGPESPITVFTTVGEGAEPVKGAFTVAEGQQISFAKGNLRYNSITETWSLAEHQYDILGSDNGKGTTTGIAPADYIDLFGWSTAKNYYGTSYYYYYDDAKAAPYFQGDFADWGENPDLINCLGTGWRTLSSDEWKYILSGRPNFNQLVGFATVNGVNGIVILPDEWEAPAGITFKPCTETSISFINNVYVNKGTITNCYTHNVLTAAQWTTMEEAGAVFLPAAGQFTKGKSLDFVGDKGFYWSSTPSGADDAYGVWFTEEVLKPAEVIGRRLGSAVRLVKTADTSASKTSIADAVITLSGGGETTTATYTYTGKPIQPAISSVTLGDVTLQEGTDFTVSYGENTNAGTNVGTVTVKGTGSYSKTATVNFTIAKAPLTVKANDNATTITYGDAPADLGVTYDGLVNGETAAVLGGKLAITQEYQQYQPVGEYKMTPSGLTSNNYNINFADGTLTVNPKPVTIVWSETLELPYNSKEQTPTATVKPEDLVNGDKCDVIVSGGGTNVGHYTATATALSNENYKLPETGLTQKFTINKVDIANVTAAPTPKTGLTYSGEEQELITPVTIEGGTMKYSLDGKNFSTEVPKGKDKKEYTVYYMIEGDANHKDTEPASLKVSIVAKVLTAQTTDSPSSKLTAEVTHEANKTAELTKVEPAAGATTITIPADIQGYRLTNITADAFNGVTDITNIILPETDEPIQIAAGALPAGVSVQVPLGQLANYALDPALKELFEAGKIKAILTAVNDWFTLSAGVDVLLPEGLTAYACRQYNNTQVLANEIGSAELTVGDKKVIKANNGVLLKGEKGATYEIVAIPGTKKSGDRVTTDNAQSYTGNQLVPVIVPTNFAAGYYWALKNNEFHSLINNASKTPAGKSVLKLNGAAARVMSIVDSAVTGIDTMDNGQWIMDNWYDLNGRKLDSKPTKKGLYILNGNKVVVK